MVARINLDWVPTAQKMNAYAATAFINFAVDTTQQADLNVATLAVDTHAIVPKFFVVDNISNGTPVTASYGPFSYVVPAYQRQKFNLPDNTKSVTVSAASGTCFIVLSEMDQNVDSQNNLLIQQTAVRTVIYQIVKFPITTPQSASDQNIQAYFNPTIGDIVYTLLPISTPIANGWFQFVYNYGTKKVAITPSGGDTLNGVFNSGVPLILNPGDGGILTSDGLTWIFSGEISYNSGNTVYTVNTIHTFNHGLGKEPDEAMAYAVCATAEFAFVAGDKVQLGYSVATARNISLLQDATAVRVIVSAGLSSISPTGPGNLANLTVANWRLVVEARVKW